MTMMDDEFAIRKLIESWVLFRDAGFWDRFRTVWHPDGVMVATWFEGPAEGFIQASEAGFNKGVNVLHTLGGSIVDVRGNRAIAQTKMAISQRAPLNGVLCDCVCQGRFYDMYEKREGRWGLVKRQPIYEKDRLDPVDLSQTVELDREKLAAMPEGYRHLAYLQLAVGMNVNLQLPGLRGAAVTALYAQGDAWLAGAQTA